MTENSSKNQGADVQEFQDKFVSKSGATSSKCPDLSQIPLSALKAAAERFEYGAQKYDRNNWRKGLDDKDYQIERLNHVLKHVKLLQAQLEFGEDAVNSPDDMWGNLGAALWGCMTVAEHLRPVVIREEPVEPAVNPEYHIDLIELAPEEIHQLHDSLAPIVTEHLTFDTNPNAIERLKSLLHLK